MDDLFLETLTIVATCVAITLIALWFGFGFAVAFVCGTLAAIGQAYLIGKAGSWFRDE